MVMHVILTNLCAFLWFWGTDHHSEGRFYPETKEKKNTQIHMRVGKDLQSTQKEKK